VLKMAENRNIHADTCALVTGATQGLGLAIAQELIADGCKNIVISNRDTEGGHEVARSLSENGVSAHFVAADLGEVDQVTAMVDAAAERMGRVTALANAGANTDRGSILDTTPEMWDALFNVNAKGSFFALQRFAQRAIDAGHAASAVNILSVVVHCGLPFLAPYAASKAALLNITKNSAHALAHNQIRVNGINVGWMDTPGEDATQRKWHGAGDDWLERAEARMPFGQLVKPNHVAGLASYMLGPASGVLNGSIVDFDQQVIGAYPDTNE
jgi:NAD(P)-dependent dehydrogenase (short-subunit alcohol dehydrogenase family)